MVLVVDACVVVVLDVVVGGGSMVDDVVVVGGGMHPPGVPIMGHSALGTNVPGPPPHRSHVAGLTLGPLTQLPSGQLQQPGSASVVVVVVGGIDVVLLVVADVVVVSGSVDDVATVVVVTVVGVLGCVVDVVVKSVVVEVVVLVVAPAAVVVTDCVVVELVVVGRVVVGGIGVVEAVQKKSCCAVEPDPSQTNPAQQLPLSPLQAPPSGLQHRPSSHSVKDTPPGDDPSRGQQGVAPQASPRAAQTRQVDVSARKAELAAVLQAPVSRCLVVLHVRRHALPAFFFGQACLHARKPA